MQKIQEKERAPMTDVIWDDSYRIGIEKIDEQHQGFFALFNELEQALKAENTEDAVTKTLDALFAYVQMHFEEEERLMSEQQYPAMNEHMAVHAAFVQQVWLMIQSRNDQQRFVIELLQMMEDWLVTHITSLDMLLGPYLNERSIR
jgi:hemerythrin